MTRQPIRDGVAIVLAIGLATSVNIITLAVLYEAIEQNAPLSENATQVLTTAFSGMVGILGAYIGFRIGDNHKREHEHDDRPDWPTPPDDAPTLVEPDRWQPDPLDPD